MFGWFKSSVRSQVRAGQRLLKDADTIIETDRQTCSAEHMLRIAELAREEFDRMAMRLERRPNDRPVVRYDVQQQHKNARRRHDSALFTATTLVLIHMQAIDLGEHGRLARARIDDFLETPLAINEADNEDSDDDTNDLSA